MALKSQNNPDENRKTQMKMQNKEIAETLRHIKNKILVMSGKGGVGKSSVAAYLSVSLAKRGHRVGLMDVDLHGPSIFRMLYLKGNLGFGGHEKKMLPVNYLPNMEVISIETLSFLDNKALLITQAFGKMVDVIVILTDPGTSSAGYNDTGDAGISAGTG